MQVTTTSRGFEIIEHEKYAANVPTLTRLVQSSSAIGQYPDAFLRPGTSFLWIGQDHHLDREEVRSLVGYLQAWLDTGSLVGTPK